MCSTETFDPDKTIDDMIAADRRRRQMIAERLGDPLAGKVGWTNIDLWSCERELYEVAPDRLEFAAASEDRTVTTIWVMAAVLALSVAMNPPAGTLYNWKSAALLLLALLIFCGGWARHFQLRRAFVFDFGSGDFWQGRRGFAMKSAAQRTRTLGRLLDIHALQIVAKYHPRMADSPAYYSYELILVLNDARRISVVNGGTRSRLDQDANTLAARLGKPIWDSEACGLPAN